MNPVVEFEKVTFAYSGNPVLVDVDLQVEDGDFLGIIGPNGGGKTTLLRLLLGILKPNRGTIRILGETVEKGRRQIGYVPQNLLYDPDFPMRVIDVAMMSRLSGRSWGLFYSPADKHRAMEMLERMGIADLARRRFGALSGGQRQRVLIARALLTEPRILVLDEPTASVDTSMERDIYELLRTLNRELTIILVSHDLGFVSTYVGKVASLNRTLTLHTPSTMTEHDLHQLYQTSVRPAESISGK